MGSDAVANPYRYLEQLQRWSDSGTPVRFLVSGTPTNALVLIESVEYGEQDGTNDIYATIILRQYRKPETPVVTASSGTATAARDSATGASSARTYTVVKGDSLWVHSGFTATAVSVTGSPPPTALPTPTSSSPARCSPCRLWMSCRRKV